MSQVRCVHADECPNAHVCRHAKQHTRDAVGHSGTRVVGCCHPQAQCKPVAKGDKCIVKDCPNHKPADEHTFFSHLYLALCMQIEYYDHREREDAYYIKQATRATEALQAGKV